MQGDTTRTNQCHPLSLGQSMALPLEHRAGEFAAVTGFYREVNVVGTPTGRSVWVEQGERLPAAPRGFGWQLVQAASTTVSGGGSEE